MVNIRIVGVGLVLSALLLGGEKMLGEEVGDREIPQPLPPSYPIEDNLSPSPAPATQPDESLPDDSSPKPTGVHTCDYSPQSIGNATPILIDNLIRTIRVTGSTVFSGNNERSAEFKERINQVILKSQNAPGLTLEEFKQKVANEITRFYAEKNYITSLAGTPIEAVDGTLEFPVIEGSLEKIEIKAFGRHQIRWNYICDRVLQGVTVPFNTARLEDKLKLLRIDPLFNNVEASLSKSESGKLGQSILTVRVEENAPISISFSADNGFPTSIGSERFGIEARYRNVTGIGDEVAGAYYRSVTGGADVFDFSYRVPLNASNGALLLRAAPNRTRITQPPVDQLDVRGSQSVYEITYRQPLYRTFTEEFAISLGFVHQSGLTFLRDELYSFTDATQGGRTRTSVIQFSQDYLLRDESFDQGGAWSMRSQFNFGTGLFDATLNEAPKPDGRFFSWLGQVRRVQRLGDQHLLLIQTDVQLTPDALLPSHQFVIGGGQSIRGYRQNALSGDNGIRFSIEDRIAIDFDRRGTPSIQVIPFIDAGYIWNHPDTDDGSERHFLSSAGVGLALTNPFGVDGLSFRIDYGLPFIELDSPGEEQDLQDSGVYFNVFYQLGD
jgi:hemolysin activation/secretion protein